MKYAHVDGDRKEAYAGGRGACPVCKGEVIAKCGTHRIAHWAHRGSRNCDSWTEPETEWHRAWKNRFAEETQEAVLRDTLTGEIHIADVRTEHGLVIEFQHSHLDPMERNARERFYNNMIWVVDGSRLQRDYSRFAKNRDRLRPTNNTGYFLLIFPDESFPAMWLDSSVPVIFDFRGSIDDVTVDVYRDTLWCLLPGRVERNAVVIAMSREQFVEIAPSRPELLPVQQIMLGFADRLRELRTQVQATELRQTAPTRVAGFRDDRRGVSEHTKAVAS